MGRPPFVQRSYDVLAVWREYAREMRGHAVHSGHFLPEEASGEVIAALRDFFNEPDSQ